MRAISGAGRRFNNIRKFIIEKITITLSQMPEGELLRCQRWACGAHLLHSDDVDSGFSHEHPSHNAARQHTQNCGDDQSRTLRAKTANLKNG